MTMKTREPFSPTHPVVMALCAAARLACWPSLGGIIPALSVHAKTLGLRPGSEEFDRAAAVVGLPYCKVLDLYVPPEVKQRAESLHWTEAYRALS